MNDPKKPDEFYRRNPDGSWTCIKQTLIKSPFGRILVHPEITFYPGEYFMGADVAALLDKAVR